MARRDLASGYLERAKSTEFPWEAYRQRLRDVMAVQIAAGTAQVQKIVIARERFGRAFVPYGRRVAIQR